MNSLPLLERPDHKFIWKLLIYFREMALLFSMPKSNAGINIRGLII